MDTAPIGAELTAGLTVGIAVEPPSGGHSARGSVTRYDTAPLWAELNSQAESLKSVFGGLNSTFWGTDVKKRAEFTVFFEK